MEEKENLILGYLEEANELKTLEDITIDLNLSKVETQKALLNLKLSAKVLEEGNDKYKYYIANNVGLSVIDVDNGKTYTLKNLVPTRLELDKTRDEMKTMKKEIKNINANLITIMSVFIAIFSIIFASSNALFQCAQMGWSCEMVGSFILIVVVLIIAVLIMLWGVKRFLK